MNTLLEIIGFVYYVDTNGHVLLKHSRKFWEIQSMDTLKDDFENDNDEDVLKRIRKLNDKRYWATKMSGSLDPPEYICEKCFDENCTCEVDFEEQNEA